MINLLPKDDKIAARKEYLRRLAAVAGVLIFAAAASGSVLMAPTMFLFLNYKKNLSKELALSNGKVAGMSAQKESEEAIKKLNSRLDFINSAKDSNRISALFKEIIGLKAAGIKIDGLSYEKQKNKEVIEEKVVIRGSAAKREEFLVFLNNLNKKYGEKKVSSPVSNIISEKDIDFAVTISLQHEK